MLGLSIHITDLIIYPSFINLCSLSIPSIATVLSINSIIKNLKFKKYKTYEDYRKQLPIRVEIDRMYNKLLDDLIKEIEESKIDKDPLSIAILVSNYLIPYGLLSYTKKFHIFTENWKEISKMNSLYYPCPSDIEGLYVIAGYGCCRHVNSFISDLFTKKGIVSDKLAAIDDNKERIETRINNFDFVTNHAIVGYIYNNKYHIIDGFNQNFSIKKDKDFYHNELRNSCIIPDFSNLSFSNKINFLPDIEYDYYDIKEVEEKEKKIEKLLIEGEFERFLDFKLNHFELLEKLAYLIPLEFERTPKNEKIKLKRI